MEFGEYIKKLRTDLKISMRELERRSGVSQSYISQLEKGIQKNPKSETIEKLAKGLNADYADLMDKAGIIEVNSFFDLFNQTSPYDNITKKENFAMMGAPHKRPIHDLHFHLTDNTAKKYYKGVIELTDPDKIEIKQLIENYLIKRLSSEEEVDREKIKILLDEGFTLPTLDNSNDDKED